MLDHGHGLGMMNESPRRKRFPNMMSESDNQVLRWEQIRDLALTGYTQTYFALKQRMEGTIAASPEGAPEAFSVDGKFWIDISSSTNKVSHEHLVISLKGHHVQWISDGETCSISLDGSESSGWVEPRLPTIEIVHNAARWQVIRSPKSGVIGNSIRAELLRENEVAAVFRMLPTRTSWLVRKLNGLLGRSTVNSGHPRIFVDVKDLEPGVMTSQATAIAMALVFRTLVLERTTLSLLSP
jgi:hypothetical protein